MYWLNVLYSFIFRKQLEDKEQLENRLQGDTRRLADLLVHLSGVLYIDELVDSSQASVELVVKKARQLFTYLDIYSFSVSFL